MKLRKLLSLPPDWGFGLQLIRWRGSSFSGLDRLPGLGALKGGEAKL